MAICIRGFKVYLVILFLNPSIIQTLGRSQEEKQKLAKQ